tara:strand:- start:6544 stop:7113 length:570 start_codon:yes stop_codon:yes gene_type:complete
MTRHTERLLSNARSKPASPGPLENPLDFIAADHMREREVCVLIDRLVANLPVERAERQMMLAFLKKQLPQHLADEELDLFPLMLKRCDPEEKINSLIDKLTSDHVHALSDAPAIAALIGASEPGAAAFADSACAQMTEFANHARRHLILENAIILPIARAHLTKDDLAIMRSHMLERRDHDRLLENEIC